MCSHGSVVHYVNWMMYLFDCKREVWNVAVEQKGLTVLKLASTPVFELCSTVTVNTHTISWQFVTILHLGKLVASLYEFAVC